MSPPDSNLTCGTVAPASRAVLDAVREHRGRPAGRPAETVEGAAEEARGFLVVPGWYAGEAAADVAALVLDGLHGLDAAERPALWALYAEGARRLGSTGRIPVPVLVRTGRPMV